jgi:hypothetical protein
MCVVLSTAFNPELKDDGFVHHRELPYNIAAMGFMILTAVAMLVYMFL